MKNNRSAKPLPWLASVAFFIMVGVNGMANALPINGRTTGDISNAYKNLFAPAGITFSIWGLIYLFLFVYTIYQFKYYREDSNKNSHGDNEVNKQRDAENHKVNPNKNSIHKHKQSENQTRKALVDKINKAYIGTSVLNSIWIFAWHYDFIFVSLLVMIGLLVSLIRINLWLRPERFNRLEALVVKTPFAIYFAWITVATIANVTVWLVSINWTGFGIEDYIWTCLVIGIGAVIGIGTMRRFKSIPYGLVLVWAYGGILLKHISPAGFNGQYMPVILVVGACLLMFTGQVSILFIKRHTSLNG